MTAFRGRLLITLRRFSIDDRGRVSAAASVQVADEEGVTLTAWPEFWLNAGDSLTVDPVWIAPGVGNRPDHLAIEVILDPETAEMHQG